MSNIATKDMFKLLGDLAWRTVLTHRAAGSIPGDTPAQQAAARRVIEQIDKVEAGGRRAGSFRHRHACGMLIVYIGEYLEEYGETEPPYLPLAPAV